MRGRVWAGFAGLCVLSGSGWVVQEWRPSVLPGLPGVAVHGAMLAGVFWAGKRLFGATERRRVAWWRVAGWGGLLVGVPPVAMVGAAGAVSTLTVVLVFAAVPVFVVFVEARRAEGLGIGESPLGLLGPALLGLAGAALVLPFHLPGSTRGAVWLGVLVAVAGASGWAAVRLRPLLEGVGGGAGAAVLAGVSGVIAGVFCWGSWGQVGWSGVGVAVEVGRCLAIDGPVLLLTVWLLREMEPVGFSARMLLVPLVTIVEGYAMVRPETSWALVAGVLMLAGGSALLLRADSGEVRAGA